MVSGDISPSTLSGPSRTKIIEENIDAVRNVVEDKPNSYIFLPTPTSNSLPDLVSTVERYAASLDKNQIITAVNDILPSAQACIESVGGVFEYKLKSFKKILSR